MNQTFEFSFPLNIGKKPLGELIISGECWPCEVNSERGYLFEPFGFDVSNVMFIDTDRQQSNVTGLYEYLLHNTADGAENFENAVVQHVALCLQSDVPYIVTAIREAA